MLTLTFTYGCRKEDLTSLPQVRTLPITDVVNGTAKSGGEILNNGGKEIIFSGIAYSKSNNMPTIGDDTTKSISQNKFVAVLKNVDPSSTYYVRAYATTEIGVGYGEVMTIATENGAPEARNLTIMGNVQIDQTLIANYTYYDFENDLEGQTTYQWYFANSADGQGETAIAGATEKTFEINSELDKKFLRVSVLPKAIAGTLSGRETKSTYFGPVGEATTVTFLYNSIMVTYNILTSPVTGRKWLDRNLGGASTPTGVNDYANFGDLFQWGRLADGHQLVIWNGQFDSNLIRINGKTFQPSSTDKPDNMLFIVSSGYPGDWRSPNNNNLWQGVNGINNPCPAGWRIPTIDEWNSEGITGLENGFANLKLTKSGFRFNDGTLYSADTDGFYWTSSIGEDAARVKVFNITDASVGTQEVARSRGVVCRCIKE